MFKGKTNYLLYAFIGIGILILAGLFFIMNPATNSSNKLKIQPKTDVFILAVKNRKLVEGKSTLTANQGDNVIIKITVDENEELHLHGYNYHIDVQKNKQGELSFKANISGRFPFELEHSKTELGSLEVAPN